MVPFVRSYLYVPGDRPDRIDKAFASQADAVVVDLEDAVAPAAKREARAIVAKLLVDRVPRPVIVRINAGPAGDADIDEIAQPNLHAVRVPKVSTTGDIERVALALDRNDCPAMIHCLIESALGVEHAFTLATAHPRVRALSLGEADLRHSLRVTDEHGLDWARSRIVVACAAAGLAPPVQSVYRYIKDLGGLRASTERGRAFGFFGRSAIHPDQIAVINDVFTPSEDEVARAREIIATHGGGADVMSDGTFVDAAVVRSADAIVELAERLRDGMAS